MRLKSPDVAPMVDTARGAGHTRASRGEAVRTALIVLAATLVACEPPPAPAGPAPGIALSFPPPSDVEEGGLWKVHVGTDGNFTVLAVVDVVGITLTDPYTNPPPEVAPDEGHWHLTVEGFPYVPSFATFATKVIPAADAAAGTYRVTAEMQENDHSPKLVDGAPVTASVEIELVVP